MIIPAGIMTVSLVNWVITGDIDPITYILCQGVVIALIIVSFYPPFPALSFMILLSSLGLIVAYPFLRAMMTTRELKSLELDQLENAYRMLGQQPRNPIAKFRIAKAVWDLGAPGHALKIAEDALPSMPSGVFIDEHRTFRNWTLTQLPKDAFRDLSCLDCGERNPPGRTHCFGCGEPFLLSRLGRKLTGKGNGKKLLAVWASITAAVIGVPFTTVLPPALGISLVIGILTVIVCILLLAFRVEIRDPAA